MPYKPTGRPNGRPRKNPLPGTISQPPISPPITPDNPNSQTITPSTSITPTPATPDSKILPSTSKINILSSKDSTPEQDTLLNIAISERGENLTKLVDTILSATAPRTRAQLVKAVELLCDGVHWLDLMGLTGINTATINGYKRQYPVIRELFHAAQDAGEDYRKAEREKIATEHATKGTDKPIYQQGALVGVIKEFDHRLLQFLLEADNPAKYRAQGNSVTVNNNVAGMIVQKHRDAPDAELAG